LNSSDDRESLVALVARARAGSREAFDELICLFEARVMKTALCLTRHTADAEDVAQEVYIKIFRFLGSYREEEKLEHWVYRITVNAFRDWRRRRRLWLPLSHVAAAFQPRDAVVDREIRSRLLDSLDRLSDREREVFVLIEIEEVETAEVAEILGCKPSTVRGYLHSAREKLRGRLRELGQRT
jgi:RNA polymerase sigma-70 factor (ECF subfamily)